MLNNLLWQDNRVKTNCTLDKINQITAFFNATELYLTWFYVSLLPKPQTLVDFIYSLLS
ncbi:hypothetical protein NSMM_820003 [Nitrosomonas mobilis]|uniref:Uncharacterized protein n=1 Tax=Nitrosomonas mobilis TaxID=51642 RepID=A0A1G5SIF2_9PROT|nr:hypothetical protein NSMM_820003 [Nitrosomonas mobilis]